MWNMRVLRFMSVRIRETIFKLCLSWYLMPTKLNKINASYLNVCWKYEKEIGTYFHMWWECEKVQRFWIQIL